MHIIGREILPHEHIALLRNRTAQEKMATFLLMLSSRYSALGFSSTKFNLSMRRQDIANFLGLTIGTVSRQLAEPSKSGIITIKQRSVQINTMDALKAIVRACLSIFHWALKINGLSTAILLPHPLFFAPKLSGLEIVPTSTDAKDLTHPRRAQPFSGSLRDGELI